MTDLEEKLVKALENSPMIGQIDRTPTGRLRIQTAFCYPDRDWIDVFVDGDRLTDFGQTSAWCLFLGGASSDDYSSIVREVATTSGVELNGDALERKLGSNPFADLNILAHACMNVAAAVVEFARIKKRPNAG